MNAPLSSRSAKKAPQLALRFGALPDSTMTWTDGVSIRYLDREVTVRLSTRHTFATLELDALHLPLPPEASARQIQDSAEAWLRQQCIAYVEALFASSEFSQLALTTWGGRQAGDAPQRVRYCPQVLLSFAARASWIVVEDANTLRCNWRLVEHSPHMISQHAEKARRQLIAMQSARATTDMFSATFN